MNVRFAAALCAFFVVAAMTALACQNRPSVPQPSEDERAIEKDMSTEEPELQQALAPEPVLQEAKESEIGGQPSTQDPAPEAVHVSNSPAVEDEIFANESDPLDIHCSVEDLDKDESKRWRRCYLGYEEQDKIRPILAKALGVAEEGVTTHSSGHALGPWLSSFYVLGPYQAGPSRADRSFDIFVIDANSRMMLSPSKESVATIFRNLKVLSDKPKPFPARAFALLLYWGMTEGNLWLDDFKRYWHRRGICVELTLEKPPPDPKERAARRMETRAYLITKDYDIEELPSCR